MHADVLQLKYIGKESVARQVKEGVVREVSGCSMSSFWANSCLVSREEYRSNIIDGGKPW